MTNDDQLIKFRQQDAAISKMTAEYSLLTIAGVEDRKGFELVHTARMEVRNCRIAVEKLRKELKEDSLNYGRKVDAEAKRINALLEPIETHLQSQEDVVVAAKEQIKREADEKRQAALQVRINALLALGTTVNPLVVQAWTEDQFNAAVSDAKVEADKRAKIEADAAELKRQQDAAEAERKRQEELAAKAERERLDAERVRLDAVRKEQEAESNRLAAERRQIEEGIAAQRRKLELEEAQRVAAERARVETERRHAEQAAREKADKEAAEAERVRLDQLKPDIDKLRDLAARLRQIDWPTVSDEEAKNCLTNAQACVEGAVAELEEFGPVLV